MLVAAARLPAGGAAAAPGTLTTRDADMIRLPGATTQIGDDAAPRDESPQFTLKVDEFMFDRTPVTVAQFRGFRR